MASSFLQSKLPSSVLTVTPSHCSLDLEMVAIGPTLNYLDLETIKPLVMPLFYLCATALVSKSHKSLGLGICKSSLHKNEIGNLPSTLIFQLAVNSDGYRSWTVRNLHCLCQLYPKPHLFACSNCSIKPCSACSVA